jgi:hypothetical protein
MGYLARIFFVLSIVLLPASSAELMFPIKPVTATIQIADQPVAVTVSGTLQVTAGGGPEELVRLKLDADLSDLQRQITSILRSELSQDNRCGDRLSVDQATLSQASPASLLTADVHYEKWGCAKAFGKEIVKKLVGGNGVIRLRLTPVVENPDTVQLQAEVLSIDADGQLSEVLRSGSFGAALQEKIRKTIVSAIDRSTKLTESLPPVVRGAAALRSVQFLDSGEGSLRLSLFGETQVSADQVKSLADQLKDKAR